MQYKFTKNIELVLYDKRMSKGFVFINDIIVLNWKIFYLAKM